MILTNKEIHISFTQHHRIDAQEFLEIKRLKNISFNRDLVDVVVDLDIEDELNLEDIINKLTSLVINIIKQKYLKEYVEKKFSSSYRKESEIIYTYSLAVFERTENLIRDAIMKKLYTHLYNEDSINIDGFLTFRLKETAMYLSSIADTALEEYLLDRDQKEFINVLKYFIDMQEAKIDLLVVHILQNGSFAMYDGEGNKIDNIDDEEIINMVLKENLNYEDFLISTLLSLCPKKIQIMDSLNNDSSKLVIETIKSIFEDRISSIFTN